MFLPSHNSNSGSTPVNIPVSIDVGVLLAINGARDEYTCMDMGGGGRGDVWLKGDWSPGV